MLSETWFISYNFYSKDTIFKQHCPIIMYTYEEEVNDVSLPFYKAYVKHKTDEKGA